MTDYELLFEYKIGQQTIKECSGITFLGWVANKINGLRTNIPGLNELAMYVRTPPMGKMSDMKKLEIVRMMEKVGIKI